MSDCALMELFRGGPGGQDIDCRAASAYVRCFEGERTTAWFNVVDGDLGEPAGAGFQRRYVSYKLKNYG